MTTIRERIAALEALPEGEAIEARDRLLEIAKEQADIIEAQERQLDTMRAQRDDALLNRKPITPAEPARKKRTP